MEEESDKRIKFLNEVWPILQEEKNHNVIREFINKISVLNDEYRFNGGVYPDVMYILSMARDEIKTLNKEICQFEEKKKPKLRKIKKKKPVVESESDSEETKEEIRQKIKNDWLDRLQNKKT